MRKKADLTPSEIEEIPRYTRMATEILKCTDPLNMDTVNEFVEYLYVDIFNRKRMPEIVVANSPLEACLTFQHKVSYPYQIYGSLYQQWADVFNWLQLRVSADKGFMYFVGDWVIQKINLNQMLNLEMRLRNIYYTIPCIIGQLDALKFAMMAFYSEVRGDNPFKRKRKDYKIVLAKEMGVVYDGIDYCVVSKRFKEIHTKDDSLQLHNESGPAIAFHDGFEIYALNGRVVPKWLVMTQPENIELAKTLATSNAEVRSEIVRKVGIERIFQQFEPIKIDTWNGYELLLFDLGDGRKRPYLKMRNPSTNEYHIEGVHPSLSSVKEALKWRNGVDSLPVILT